MISNRGEWAGKNSGNMFAFLSPQPYRGKRNEPANVRIVAEKIAQLKDEQLDSVAKITTAEADRLFRWREIH